MDYTEQLNQIIALQQSNYQELCMIYDALRYIACFIVFFIVVTLLYFTYEFFNIFFKERRLTP